MEQPKQFITLEDLPQEEVQSQSQEFGLAPGQKLPKKKSIFNSKKLAAIIGVVGFVIIGIIFYFLFHSIGVI